LFFRFHPFTLDFYITFCLIVLITMYLVLNHLSSFSFQIHPFTLDFYIKFGSHSFNCDVFGLKSFIELICLRVSSLNILFLYQIWSSFFFIVICSCSYPFFFIEIVFFFIFIPYDLILFYFCVRFGYLSF
jgi:hypothetical protein